MLVVCFMLEQVRVFVYKSFPSLCCSFLGAAPVPYTQDTIFNLPNLYIQLLSYSLKTNNISYCNVKYTSRFPLSLCIVKKFEYEKFNFVPFLSFIPFLIFKTKTIECIQTFCTLNDSCTSNNSSTIRDVSFLVQSCMSSIIGELQLQASITVSF